MRLFASVILALACTVFAEDIPEVDDSINIHAGTKGTREPILSILLRTFFGFNLTDLFLLNASLNSSS